VWSDWIEKFHEHRRASQLSEREKKVKVDNLIDLMGEETETVFEKLVFLTESHLILMSMQLNNMRDISSSKELSAL